MLSQVLEHISWAGAGDLNPGTGEDGAGNQDEGDVDDSVEGVAEDGHQTVGGRDVVHQTGDRVALAANGSLFPASEESDEHEAAELLVEELGEEEEVGDEGALQDDGDVGGVEQLDGVRSGVASDLLVMNSDVDLEALGSV